jgi:hypothetical protein
MQAVPAVLSLLFGSWSAVSEFSGSETWEEILYALQRRGICEVRLSISSSMHIGTDV